MSLYTCLSRLFNCFASLSDDHSICFHGSCLTCSVLLLNAESSLENTIKSASYCVTVSNSVTNVLYKVSSWKSFFSLLYYIIFISKLLRYDTMKLIYNSHHMKLLVWIPRWETALLEANVIFLTVALTKTPVWRHKSLAQDREDIYGIYPTSLMFRHSLELSSNRCKCKKTPLSKVCHHNEVFML